MPRQDVPYGGTICRLKERIAEIWDKLGEKLHSINGVEGDGAGDVKIVSGDAAVVISNDQIGHKIKVGLDKSKLPSAAVSSVNGKTGAVRLDAADIPSDGNSDVQADIAANKAAINKCSDSITSEQTARENADAALQTNINAARASIPELSTAPDPYKGIKRDTQGRAFAADPASGATDKTLVTANWVSQTGEGRPNNLVHNTGDEAINGVKSFIQNIVNIVNCPGNTSPISYFAQFGRFKITGNDNVPIAGFGIEKSTSNVIRIVLNINANQNTETRRQPQAQIHFILDEDSGTIRLQAAHVDKNGKRTLGTPIDLMTWTP